MIIQHSQQQRLCALQVALRGASLRDARRRSEQIDNWHECRAVRESLLRLVKMQPSLCAHQTRFAMVTVDLENLAEHSLGGREFVFVLQQPCAT